MALPTYVASGTASSGTTSPRTPTYPAGLAANDRLFLVVNVRATDAACPTPSGWTFEFQDSLFGTGVQFIFSKLASGSETGSFNVAWTGTTTGFQAMAWVHAFRGVTTATRWYEPGGSVAAGGTASAMPTVATTGSDRLALAFLAYANGSETITASTGETGGDWVEPIGEATTGASIGMGLQLQTAGMASAGILTGGSGTFSGVSNGYCVRTLALIATGGTLAVGAAVFISDAEFTAVNNGTDSTEFIASAGDIVFLAVGATHATAAIAAFANVPSDNLGGTWTLVAQNNQGAGPACRAALFKRSVGASSIKISSISFTASSTPEALSFITFTVNGGDINGILSATGVNASGDPTATLAAAPAADSTVVCTYAHRGTASAGTPPTGFTVISTDTVPTYQRYTALYDALSPVQTAAFVTTGNQAVAILAEVPLLSTAAVGTANGALNRLAGAASGTHVPFFGSAAATRNVLAGSASGTHIAFIGPAAGVRNPLAGAGTGTHVPHYGAAAAILNPLGGAAAGVHGTVATAAATLNPLQGAGAGAHIAYIGPAAAVVNPLAGVSTGAHGVAAAVTAIRNPLAGAATGLHIPHSGAAAGIRNPLAGAATATHVPFLGTAAGVRNPLQGAGAAAHGVASISNSTVIMLGAESGVMGPEWTVSGGPGVTVAQIGSGRFAYLFPSDPPTNRASLVLPSRTDLRLSFRTRATTLTVVGDNMVTSFPTTNAWQLGVSAADATKLAIRSPTTERAAGVTAMVANTWYSIVLELRSAGLTRCWLNGNLEFSLTMPTFAADTGLLFLGWGNNTSYFDDIVVSLDPSDSVIDGYQIIIPPPSLTGAGLGTHNFTGFSGVGAGQVNRLDGAAVAVHGVVATAAGTVNRLTGAAAGVHSTTGTGVASLNKLAGAAVAVHPVAGAGAATLNPLTGFALGTWGGSLIFGVAAGTLNPLQGAAVGVRGVVGTAAASVNRLTGAATGVHAVTVIGVGTAVRNPLAGAAVAKQGTVATAAAVLNPLLGAAAAIYGSLVAGTAAATLRELGGDAVGTAEAPIFPITYVECPITGFQLTAQNSVWDSERRCFVDRFAEDEPVDYRPPRRRASTPLRLR